MVHCALCEREMENLTDHHLLPQAQHTKKRLRRDHTLAELRAIKIDMCRPCHDFIHAFATERELEMVYNTREALLACPDIAKFVNWIKKKHPDTVVPIRRNNRRSK